ncbi:hypothetical protein PTKIN_Ptkin06aG0207300 [Pterospermum kingtungense]
MASSPKCYSLLALLAILVFVTPTLSADQATQKLIDNICRGMEEYAFCNNAFNQNIHGPSADIKALTQITIEQSTNNATKTHSYIVERLKNEKDPAEKNALTTCEHAYSLVMDCFSKAAASFFAKDYDGMLKSERPAARAEASCSTIFNTPPNPPDPVGDRNRQMRILIAMAFAAGTDLMSNI